MHSRNPPSRHHRWLPDSWTDIWTHAVIWVLLVVASLLLVGFTAVVSDITQRGEMRRMHQRASGSLMLPDELQNREINAERLVAITSNLLVGR
jgi:hypothetical protein